LGLNTRPTPLSKSHSQHSYRFVKSGCKPTKGDSHICHDCQMSFCPQIHPLPFPCYACISEHYISQTPLPFIFQFSLANREALVEGTASPDISGSRDTPAPMGQPFFLWPQPPLGRSYNGSSSLWMALVPELHRVAPALCPLSLQGDSSLWLSLISTLPPHSLFGFFALPFPV
jgi:hypothetical protein